MSNLATVTHLRPSQRPVERRVAEVEDGYTRLANALYEELIGADLTKNQSKVAHAICRKTYGYGKKMDRISDTRTESHLEYLQSRGISPEVVKRYEVVSGKVWNGERELDALVLPYKRDGELLQVKRISTERPDGKKVIMAEGDCEPCLFGWQALDAGVRAVVLCEGEIDCMSYAQYGISALPLLIVILCYCYCCM